MKVINTDLRKYKVVDGDYKITATYSDRFVLFRNGDYVEIILDEELLNKPVKIYLDGKLLYNDVLDTTSLFIPVNFLIDLDMLANNILIKLDS
jgi:hypothetical protein